MGDRGAYAKNVEVVVKVSTETNRFFLARTDNGSSTVNNVVVVVCVHMGKKRTRK